MISWYDILKVDISSGSNRGTSDGIFGNIRGMFPMNSQEIFPNKIPEIFANHYYGNIMRIFLKSPKRTNGFLL